MVKPSSQMLDVRIDRQRSEDRKADGDRLDRIETDIRSMRDMLFDAFQRGRSD